MKISVDGVELFELTETQKKVIKDEINADSFEADMKRRLEYILKHKYEQCFTKLKNEWDPKLAGLGIEAIPTDPNAYAELIFALPQYKDAATRKAEMIEI